MRNSIFISLASNCIASFILVYSVVCVANMSGSSGERAKSNAIRQLLEGWDAGYPAYISNDAIANQNFLLTLYQEREFKPLWLNTVDERITLTPPAHELLQTIRAIDSEGLIPEDYHLKAIEVLSEHDVTESIDLLLTDAFLTLAQHLLAGKVDPEELTSEWKSHREHIDAALLIAQLEQQSVNAVLNSLRPRQPRYQRMIRALETLKNMPAENWLPLALAPVIKPGQHDERLPDIAQRLISWGDLHSELFTAGTTAYDEVLKSAIMRFQMRHGLDNDGVIGKNTLLALNVTPQQRVNQLIVNLERWRWLDQTMGDSFIVVNIANFDLRVYLDGEMVMKMPVIVGRNFRKTPVFSDRIRYLVLNPTWTVPQTLAIQDKLPEIKKDVNYLKNFGFTLYELGTNNIVDADTVDWAKYKKQFPFRLVQAPGPLNALGQIKFMFPNPYDVYLHDTPSKELFGKHERAFSSGCIRVSKPVELAELLLKPQGLTSEYIQQLLATPETVTVNLTQTMPVHIEYWTAWVDGSDLLQFRTDIYERDEDVLKELIGERN